MPEFRRVRVGIGSIGKWKGAIPDHLLLGRKFQGKLKCKAISRYQG
jgi:hypothetical protein